MAEEQVRAEGAAEEPKIEEPKKASITSDRGSFTTGQSWGALRKAWKGYRIAKVQGDSTRAKEQAFKIRRLQRQLSVSVSAFPHLDIPTADKVAGED